MSELTESDVAARARQFVAARRSATTLDGYPGAVPDSLDDAYRIQDCAISLWDDSVVGWKVGQVRIEHREKFGSDRILGPIFKRHVRHASDKPDMPLFDGAFAVVEAEYIAILNQDTPTSKAEWTPEEALAVVGDLRVGIETAGSPVPALNEYGAAAVVSDFGAHGGLVIGPSIADWPERNLDALECETFVNDVRVGSGGPRNLDLGIARSIQATLESTARRGRALKAGHLISTGATTGVHAARPGDQVRVCFGSDGEVRCQIKAALPLQ
ncbi:MAG: fumarylacetoacetate hydrolase family protein [Pseudomonadota bacterium]